MSLFLVIVVSCALVVTTMNVITSIRLVRSPCFSRGQKIAQLLFLWLLPVVGFAFVWHFLNEVDPPRVTTDLRTWLESDDIARRLSNVQLEEATHRVEHGGGD